MEWFVEVVDGWIGRDGRLDVSMYMVSSLIGEAESCREREAGLKGTKAVLRPGLE